MRFMYIVTSSQPNRGPTPALMEAMGKLADREIKAGRMLDNGGLMPVQMGAQVKITDGKLSVVDGPFVESQGADRRLRDLRAARQGRGCGGGKVNSCSCTSITCRAGKEPARSARSRRRTWKGPARSMRGSPLEADAPRAVSAAMTAADIHRTILAVWRIEQPRLITSLSRMLRDVPLAEDLTQDALVAALEHWPATGVPENPGAWLMATAKRRALDHLRRGRMLACKHEIDRAGHGAGAAGHARFRLPRWMTTSATNCCG